MNEYSVKVANTAAFVAIFGMMTVLYCKMVDKFGRKPA